MKVEMQRVTRQEQIDSLVAIAEKVWHLTYEDITAPGQVEYMLEHFQSDHAVKDQMANLNYRYYMIVCDGKDAGFVGFSPRYEGKEEMFLSKVYILPEYRGQGAVNTAFDLVFDETRKEGLHRIRLTVNKQNTHAVEVYKHFGFFEEEKVVTDIGGGYVMDDYIMVKNL